MHGGELVKEARKRAGLSQQRLAELLLTTQPVIARWETQRSAPSFKRVVEAIRACGFDLAVRIGTRDDQHETLIRDNLALTPEERLERLRQSHESITRLIEKVRLQNPTL